MGSVNFPTDHNSSGEIFQEALADLDGITNRSIAEIDDIASTSSEDESDPEIELNINRPHPDTRKNRFSTTTTTTTSTLTNTSPITRYRNG